MLGSRNQLGVTKPTAIFACLELGELLHIDAIPLTEGDMLSEVVLSGPTFEADDKTSTTFAREIRNTRDARQPLKERQFIAQVVENHTGIHLFQG